MRPKLRFVITFVLAALIGGGAFLLSYRGVYGWTLFILLPIALGALSTAFVRPSGFWSAALIGAFANVIAACSLLVFGIEGVGCLLMCLPLATPLGALGGTLAYRLSNPSARPQAAALMLLAPMTLAFDLTAPPTEFKVHSEVAISASPETVWKHVVTFSDLPEPTEWYFRGGIAYPKRARIEGSGPGATRYCEFSTGPFVEPIDVWDEPRRLAFHVTQNPAPMEEFSPYGRIVPKHLHGYMISKHGEFRLTPLAGGGTLLEGNTWYQHGLWPGEYWRWWSDAIIHRIHLRVLNHIKQLAEQDLG